MFDHGIFGNLPRLKGKKSPWLALIIGFFFGCLGMALYFRTFADFLIPCLLISLITISTAGIGIVGSLVLCGLYGYFRAADSNERNGY